MHTPLTLFLVTSYLEFNSPLKLQVTAKSIEQRVKEASQESRPLSTKITLNDTKEHSGTNTAKQL